MQREEQSAAALAGEEFADAHGQASAREGSRCGAGIYGQRDREDGRG
jgi:hypothetical protein